MVDNDMPGAWPVWTPGAPLAGFIKRNTIHSRLPNVPVLNRWLRQKIDRSSFRLSMEVARKVNNCCMLFVV